MDQQYHIEENDHATVWIESLLKEQKQAVRSYERMDHRQAWEEAGFINAKNRVRALKRALKLIQIDSYQRKVVENPLPSPIPNQN